jgi:manganese transport protein
VITMIPALIVIGVGFDLTRALVLSQVVLSFGIPFALIPLVIFCRDRRLMGTLVNHRPTTAISVAVVAVIVSLNVFLITLLITGR